MCRPTPRANTGTHACHHDLRTSKNGPSRSLTDCARPFVNRMHVREKFWKQRNSLVRNDYGARNARTVFGGAMPLRIGSDSINLFTLENAVFSCCAQAAK
jgi:hypothetical protein